MPKISNRESLSQIAPKLSEITEEILFNDIWKREALSPRERSLITLAILTALGKDKQIPWHISFAKSNGLDRDEIAEIFTHSAFYAGWPAAISAFEHLD